jgi:hypothetical protein
METKYIVQKIIKETSFWDLERWRYFRNVENPDYFNKKDNYERRLLTCGVNSYNYIKLENEYKRWKLSLILHFNRKTISL